MREPNPEKIRPRGVWPKSSNKHKQQQQEHKQQEKQQQAAERISCKNNMGATKK